MPVSGETGGKLAAMIKKAIDDGKITSAEYRSNSGACRRGRRHRRTGKAVVGSAPGHARQQNSGAGG